ncbi:MAG TPA: cupredoxin family copper-binding protein [Candidatus Saccharimonadales bacterium]|nr:cupredoxin family copper-binding protein [Candidatus Saccharimonadales bacterium]
MLKYVIGLVVVIAVAAAAFFVFGGNKDQSNTQPSPSPSTSQNTATPPANNQPASTANKVTISNFSFSPSDISVKKGTTVTWTNSDSVQHTVTVDSGNDGPKSQPLSNGQSYSFTFNDEGTFNYHCSFHPEMHGTVTVTE